VIPGPVLRAFGLAIDIPLRPVGRVFVAGDLVLKPVDDEAEATWVAETLGGLAPDGVRLASPVHAGDGRWVLDGWSATRRIRGAITRDWDEILAAGAAFHRATAHLERPAVLDGRTHRWAVADRAAWGEQVPPLRHPLVDAITERLRPLDLPSQVVHGDLTGNVLTADGLPPAVIDFSPYWRPPAWAAAVVVVDAVVWWRAGFELAVDHAPQLLARATLYRLFCESDSRALADAYRPWVEHLCRLLDAEA
jgi:uncharacterized protein (TIGR02569 family)